MLTDSINGSNSLEKWFKATMLIIIMIISFTGTFFSAFYLVVNINEIPGKIGQTTIKENKTQHLPKPKTNSPNKASAIKTTLYENISPSAVETTTSTTRRDTEGLFWQAIHFFKGVSLDLSGVTPFLLFMFFICSFIGSWQLLLKPVGYRETIHETFPFPRNHNATWIQLGFIGTLWAFFIIGLRMAKIKNVGGVELVDILTKAFGTAIISTLTAVVLVYIFSPLLRSSLRWIFGLSFQPPISAIERQLSELSEKVKAARQEAENNRNSVNQLNKNVNECSSNVKTLSTNIEELAKSDFKKTMDSLVDAAKTQTSILKALNKKTEEMENRDTKIQENLSKVSEALIKFNETFTTKTDKLIETINTDRQETREIFTSAVKSFDDRVNQSSHFFTSRVINILVKLIHKIKSIWKDHSEETEQRIKASKQEVREWFSGELVQLSNRIDTLNKSLAEVDAQQKQQASPNKKRRFWM